LGGALAEIISKLILSLHIMTHRSKNRDFLFLISDVARLLRTYADQKARQFGMTRAQWAVLLKLERYEGLNQSDLAEYLDIQPIALPRLVDGFADGGLMDRRPDPTDRRAKLLYPPRAAGPLIEPIPAQVGVLAEEVLAGIAPAATDAVLSELGTARENL